MVPVANIDNLFQGRLYRPIYVGVIGSQYLSRALSNGEVLYREKTYNDLPLWYDIFADDLVLLLRRELSVDIIRLTKDFIQEFKLDSRRFINSQYGRYADLELDNGYYEVLLKDRITLLARRNINVVTRDAVPNFIRKDRWFFILNDAVYPLNGKKSFLQAVGEDLKDEMADFAKDNKIRWGKAGDAEWLVLSNQLNALFK
jgi:hypothetical protein